MKLLVITQKVDKNDPILGFFHAWLARFSKDAEKVTVICLEKGIYDLPSNVEVVSLGKESGVSRIKYIFNFYYFILKYIGQYDSVFVHMNQIYVTLGFPVWKIYGKNISLWYTHKAVSASLKIAYRLADVVFTASKESFRIEGPKVKVMGHGIDTSFFKSESRASGQSANSLKLITVGRISKVKNLDLIISAVKMIREKIEASLVVVGGSVTNDDEIYFKEIKEQVKKIGLENAITFVGPKAQSDIVPYLSDAEVFVHTSSTGSLDKAVLEAMTNGLLVVSSNDAIVPIISQYGLDFKAGDVNSLVSVLGRAASLKNDSTLHKNLTDIVVKNHSLDSLISRIVSILNFKK